MVNQGYTPRKPIGKPKPAGPANQRVGLTLNGLERPPTDEYLSSGKCNGAIMEPMSVITFFAFMFCAFCIGIAVGGVICGN